MSIRSHKDLESLRIIGRIVRRVLDAVAKEARAGVTTLELDKIGEQELARWGARSAPRFVYGFPGALCISVNDEAIHGIPGERVLRDGDLLKLDLVAEKDGYYADAAITVGVGSVAEQAAALKRCAERAFHQGLAAARPGNRAYDIGRAVEKEVRASGFSVLSGLCGHGVGRAIHEDPQIPNNYDRNCRARLTEGMVVTIEPIIAAGRGEGRLERDRWTIRTADGSLAAHFEHTIVISQKNPIVLTAAA